MFLKKCLTRQILMAVFLLLAVIATAGFGLVIRSRIDWTHHRHILESNADFVLAISYEPHTDFLDRMFGLDSRPIDKITLGKHTGPPVLIPGELLDATGSLSPLWVLQIEHVEVEPAKKFPLVEHKVFIDRLHGKHAGAWLKGFLDRQLSLEYTHIEHTHNYRPFPPPYYPPEYTVVIRETPAFNDQHLEQLLKIPGRRIIRLEQVSITGAGFGTILQQKPEVQLFLVDCPLTDAGLREILNSSESLTSLVLEFSERSTRIPDLKILSAIAPNIETPHFGELRVSVVLDKIHVSDELNAAMTQLKQKYSNFSYRIADE